MNNEVQLILQQFYFTKKNAPTTSRQWYEYVSYKCNSFIFPDERRDREYWTEQSWTIKYNYLKLYKAKVRDARRRRRRRTGCIGSSDLRLRDCADQDRGQSQFYCDFSALQCQWSTWGGWWWLVLGDVIWLKTRGLTSSSTTDYWLHCWLVGLLNLVPVSPSQAAGSGQAVVVRSSQSVRTQTQIFSWHWGPARPASQLARHLHQHQDLLGQSRLAEIWERSDCLHGDSCVV